MSKVRIGFDAKRLFFNREGLGSYARTLIHDILTYLPEYELHLYTPELRRNEMTAPIIEHPQVQVHTPERGSMFWRSKGMISDLRRDNINIYWGLSNELPYGIKKEGIHTIVTIHDLIHRKFPAQFKLADRMVNRLKFTHATQASDLIIVPSSNTKDDLLSYYPEASSKTKVMYQSVNPQIRQATKNTGQGEYLLFVGTINERKNLKLLIQALGNMKSEDRYKVKVVGEGKKYKRECLDMIDGLGLSDHFDFVSNVSTDELIVLYQNAKCLVFPSHYEGFGIPAIEALTLNIPVIISNSTSLPEIIGQHGIVIDNFRAETLTNALYHIKSKECRSKTLIGVEDHIKKFDPQTITLQVKGLIDSLLN